MPVSFNDNDQPGLWPITQTGTAATAKPAKRQRGASTSSEQQPVKLRAGDDLPTGNEALWRVDDLATYLGIPKHTIYGWRKTNHGPPAIKVGKHLRWRPAAVIEWARHQERSTQ
jgi:predicted DNA-binding transcriptional regulator AlpA